MKLRITAGLLASIAIVAGWAGAPASSRALRAGTPSMPVRRFATTVALDCEGVHRAVTVTAAMPVVAAAGRAVTVIAGTDLPGGAVTLSLIGAAPATLTLAPAGAPTTTQVVVDGAGGDRLSIDVVGASVVERDPGSSLPVRTVSCTAEGPNRVGTIRVSGGGPPSPATAAVDVAVPVACYADGAAPATVATVAVRATVPTLVAPGHAFTLDDLSVTGLPAGALPVVVTPGATITNPPPFGTTFQWILPGASIAPSGGAGSRVDIRLDHVGVDLGGVAGTCLPVGSGHVASVPVVDA